MDEFSAIAFARSARSSTSSTTNAWRAGVSNALMRPWTTWSSRIDRTVTRAGQRQAGERQRLQHRQDLRHEEDPVAIPAIDEHAGERRDEQRRNLTAESNDAEEQFGAGQAIDQPARRDAGDPRADERDALATEEEAVIGMSKGPGEPAGSDHAPYCCRSGVLFPAARIAPYSSQESGGRRSARRHQ